MKQFVYIKNLNTGHSELQLNDVGYIEESTSDKLHILFMRINRKFWLKPNDVVEFDVSKTGDDFEYKVCDRCFKHLGTNSEFSDNRIKKNSITKRPSCKACRKIKDGKSISSVDREYWDKKKPIDYTPFKCPICKKTTIAGLSKVVLDHCHKTGLVRGYLCESCNTGIGRFDDDPDLVKDAVNWLEKKFPMRD